MLPRFQGVLRRCFKLLLLGHLAVLFYPGFAFAVRPFVTDDASIIYKGQVVAETYGGVKMANGDKST